MEDEKPDEKTADNLELPTSLGKIGSKSEHASEKRLLSIPPIDKSEEFVKGYKAGYQDGKSGKQPKF